MKTAWVILLSALVTGCCSSGAKPGASSGDIQMLPSATPSYTFEKVIESYDGGAVFLELVPQQNDP